MKKKEKLLYFISFIILISFLLGAYSDFTRKVSDEEHDMVQHLALTESKINEVTNQNIIRMIGIATHISTNTNIDAEELDYFIEEIVDIDSSIINNITIFEDTTAVYFHPYEPNLAIKDVNLVDLPTQKDDALRVKNLLEIVITPPVELVQGGIGIMTRIPITLPDGSYWGQLGYMMTIEDIIESLSLDTDKYTYLITKYDNDNHFSHIVYDSGFEEEFLTNEIIVELPSGYWSVQIAYSNLLELTSPVFYILIISAITFFGLSIYILSKFNSYNIELLHMAQIDELTGLKNRRSIKDSLETFNTALMLDIDDFKKINDNYGHYVGDEILLQLSKRIETVTRQNDVVVRWGGEEFLVLMISIDKDSALIAANRVLQVFNEPFIVNENKIDVKASIGVASSCDNPNIKMNRIIKAADDAMYISKRNGKNQININETDFTSA